MPLHHTDHIPPGRLGNPTGPGGVGAPSPGNRWCPPFRPHAGPPPGTLLHREESSEQRARSPGAAPGRGPCRCGARRAEASQGDGVGGDSHRCGGDA